MSRLSSFSRSDSRLSYCFLPLAKATTTLANPFSLINIRTGMIVASIGISLPILDWGRGKGRVRVARSNVDLVDTQAEQGMKDFELNVCKMVRQFNLQAYRVAVAAKTDKTADRRHDVARRLYILGKSTILDLNAAITEKDTARRNYITALKTYWSLYYGIRSMTGYDFLRKAEISCTIPKP